MGDGKDVELASLSWCATSAARRGSHDEEMDPVCRQSRWKCLSNGSYEGPKSAEFCGIFATSAEFLAEIWQKKCGIDAEFSSFFCGISPRPNLEW
jgi:hypothetical protein